MVASITDPASDVFRLSALPTFVTATIILLLGLVILIRERGSLVHALFCVMMLITSGC